MEWLFHQSIKRYLIVILIIGLVLISGCTSQIISSTKPVTTEPVPIFESRISVDTVEDVKSVFEQNSERILANTLICRNSSKTQKLLFQYAQVAKIETGAPYYTVKIPVVHINQNWDYNGVDIVVSDIDCKDPAELQIMVDGVQQPCKSGTVNRNTVASNIKYYVTPDGVVYYPGRIRTKCRVTDVEVGSFALYRQSAYMHIWMQGEIPLDCDNRDSTAIAEIELENSYIQQGRYSYQGQTKSGDVRHDYLKVTKWLKGKEIANTIILLTAIEVNPNFILSKKKTYEMFITTSNTKTENVFYTLTCGNQSIKEI